MKILKRLVSVWMCLLLLCLSVGTACAGDKEPLVCAGGSFMYFRDDQGVWYCCGDNQFGQLGRGNKTTKKEVFVFASKNQDLDLAEIKNVYCGCDYSYFLMNDGRIFAVGNLSAGRLMNQGGMYLSHTLVKLEDRTIVTMATGYGQTLALNEAGELYAWGRNHAGQVGNGKRQYPTSVVKLDLPKITSIACGGFHSAAIDENGDLWLWGDNSYHQISADNDKYYLTPVKMDLGDIKAAMVELGGHFTAVVDQNGDLYMWGRNDACQCSITSGKKKFVTERVKVDLPLPVKSIACYGSHTWCLLEDGSVWSWGCDGYGELGYGFRTPADTGLPLSLGDLTFKGAQHDGPYCSRILDSGAVKITTGDLFGVILLEDGTLLTAGMNKFGQLGRTAPYNGDASLGTVDVCMIHK